MTTCPHCRRERLLLMAVAVFLLAFIAGAVVTLISWQAGFDVGVAAATAIDTYAP